MDLSVYVHIPFCKTKCLYCDFVSATEGEGLFLPYKDALINEIKSFDFSNYSISTVFIGGGTPTVLPPSYIGSILNEIFKNKAIKDAEVTIEGNPNTITEEFLKEAKACGVNRISIGLQAWQNRLLKILGRSHTIDDFLKAYSLICKAGFKNVNADLMFSLPTQTEEDLAESINNITELGVTHISLYSLIIEEGTPFFKMHKAIDEGVDRNMYYLAKELMFKKGFLQYEISNFSKEGFQSRHNLAYWDRKDYIGFGTAAHSLIGGKRFNNSGNIKEYIEKRQHEDVIALSEKDCMEEFMFLGLRKTKGVALEDFQRLFHKDLMKVYGEKIYRLVELGLIKLEGGRLFLTDRGIDVSNVVFSEFLLEDK